MRTGLLQLICLFTFIFAAAGLSDDASAKAKLRVVERTTYYSVSGKTGAELFRSIQRRAPTRSRGTHAIATTNTNLKFNKIRLAQKGRRCVLKSGSIVMRLTYTYPRWTNKRRASNRVKKNWNRFMARLKRHEQTHGKISKQFAADLNKALVRVGRSARNCRQYDQRAKREVKKLTKKWHRKQNRFDKREASSRSRIRRLQKALLVSR